MNQKLKLNNITYRNADISDLDTITKYRMKLWDSCGKFSSKKEYKEIYNKNREYFKNHFREESIIIPIYQTPITRKIIAMGIGVIIQKPVINWDNMGQEGYIFNMFTEDAYRGKGLATNILKEINLFFKMKNVNKVTLTANENSKNIYQKEGMKPNPDYMEIIL